MLSYIYICMYVYTYSHISPFQNTKAPSLHRSFAIQACTFRVRVCIYIFLYVFKTIREIGENPNFPPRLSMTTWRFIGSYKWGYKPPDKGCTVTSIVTLLITHLYLPMNLQVSSVGSPGARSVTELSFPSLFRFNVHCGRIFGLE